MWETSMGINETQISVKKNDRLDHLSLLLNFALKKSRFYIFGR